MSRPNLPPGSDGLPLLGETLDFAKNPFAFVETRLARHGRIFRSSVLGRKTVVMAGADATGAFIDAENVEREGSMPPHIQELFGGRSLPLLDGDVHRARKQAVLQAFGREALDAYLPLMQKTTENYFQRWAAEGEIGWLEEMKRLAIEIICSTVIGMEPGPEMDRLRRDYGTVTDGFATLPIPLPGTPYSKARAARDRIFAVLERSVRERQSRPAADGLTRMLARSPEGGALTDQQAVLELHHVVIAGYIVFAEFAETVRRLDEHPEVVARIEREVRQAPAVLTTAELVEMPYTLQVVNEVKRLCPIIPAVFGRARRDFRWGSFTIPSGWMVMWAVHPSHVSHGVYDQPERFDPDRFSAERAEHRRHPHAFAPQGAGPAIGHRCPGLDLATIMMQLFTVQLFRGYRYRLLEPGAPLDFSKTPPEPSDGLRAIITAEEKGS